MTFRLTYTFLFIIGLIFQIILWKSYWWGWEMMNIRNTLIVAVGGLLRALISLFVIQISMLKELHQWKASFLFHIMAHISFAASCIFFLYNIWINRVS